MNMSAPSAYYYKLCYLLKNAQNSYLAHVLEDQPLNTRPREFCLAHKTFLGKLNSFNLYHQNTVPKALEIEDHISTSPQCKKDRKYTKAALQTPEDDQDHLLLNTESPEDNKMAEESDIVKAQKEKQKPAANKNGGSRKKKNFWTSEEDQTLLELMKTYGEKWTKMGRCLGGRSGKQVRDRYLNYLKPSIRQKGWTHEEEELLGKLYQEFGNKWSTIALYLPGRTENQVKNKFYAKFRKGELGQYKEDQPQEPLVFVKMDPAFEKTLNSERKGKIDQDYDHTQTVKKEEFEACDGMSQSTQQGDQSAEHLIESLKSKRATSFLSEHSIREELSPNNVKYEESSDPYKKIKREPIENEKTIAVKQEAL